MIYFCADDYGLCNVSSMHIKECVERGVLNKVSVFPNFELPDISEIVKHKEVRLSLHINLVEGKCMADADEINLIADKNGNFIHTFGGLFKLNVLQGKKLEEQAYQEIKAQVLFWKNILPEGAAFCVDSHQHTHMIPSIFRAVCKVLHDEQIDITYMRIPAEPLLPYLKIPSLYCTYRPVNLIKQWLLKGLWFINAHTVEVYKIPASYFFGILLSGKMDEKRVRMILPEYMKMAEKNGRDIEVLFHPGYVKPGEADFKKKHIAFEKFYISENRKTEYDAVIKIKERSVL